MYSERIVTREGLAERIYNYLPSQEVLDAYPSPKILDLKTRDRQEEEIPGAAYALTTSRLDGRLVIVPYHHPENCLPPESPGVHYSHVAFEGISLVPGLNQNGELVSANIVLYRERMQRMRSSIRAIRGGIPEESLLDQFDQGIIDLSAVLAHRVLRDRDGMPTRAYTRPAYIRLGTYGVSPKKEAPYHMSTIEWNWPLYISKEAYEKGATAVVFLDAQRFSEVRGKLAGNYSDGGVLTQSARDLGGNEVLYLGPYIVNEFGKIEYVNYQEGKRAKVKLQEAGILADGSGEDVLFEGWDGTVYYQPKDTNILGGTTRDYILNHICRTLEIPTSELTVSLADIRKGDIVGMSYVGNAVKVLGAKRIDIYDTWKDESKLLESVELTLSPSLRAIQSRFEAELFSLIPASHPSLLTPIDLEWGREVRKILDYVYSSWF